MRTVRGMLRDDDALQAWGHRLLRAEAWMQEREDEALAQDPTPAQLAAFAAEREQLAGDRDEMADQYDELAFAQVGLGLRRDATASDRDRHARAREQDLDIASADRAAAGLDRDHAAVDRADSHDDRGRAVDARHRAALDRGRASDDRHEAAQLAGDQDRQLASLRTALESRLVIGQAVGLLMARHAVRRDDAFSVLVRLSQERDAQLREVAVDLVASAEGDLPDR